MRAKKVLAVTAIRSDYDLMSPLYMRMQADPAFELKLLVAGAHLCEAYGHSIDLIRADGLEVLMAFETLIHSDSKASRIKSASLFMQNAIDVVAHYAPDLIVYAGDREDVMVAGLIGAYLEIPTLHFYGGDHVKDSHVDNPVRHAASKLSTAHFVSHPLHRERLMKMGEPDERIFHVGSIALDRFVEHVPMPDSEIAEAFGLEGGLPERFALMIFHPIPEERGHTAEYFENILLALRDAGIHTFVSYPNVDPGNSKIIEVIERYREEEGFVFYRNLPRGLFLSLYKRAGFLIGNSSSGILEAASVPLPVVNVGVRQCGRMAPDNVLFCATGRDAIADAIATVQSVPFREKTRQVRNPYGDGESARRALELIKSTDFGTMIYKNEDALELS